MIDKLQRRFILICTVSVFSVVLLVFGAILLWNVFSLNRTMDVLVDQVSAGGGRFPAFLEEPFKPDSYPPKGGSRFDFITPETPFSTRHFSVFFNRDGEVAQIFTESIYSIDEETAIEYAEKALEGEAERAWISNYRYKVFSAEFGEGVVFVDGSVNRAALMQSVAISGFVLLACALLFLLLIVFLSKRAVRPIAESYEKQKQFITDAGHELKTPLTLILANLDIAESELGKNEWLDDIRAEGYRMNDLVGRLVELSRMDEEKQGLNVSEVPLGRIVLELVDEFEPLARGKGKCLSAAVDETLVCRGDEMLLRRLVGILLDNAVKYCDSDGEIFLSLQRGRHTVLTVENTYASVSEVELNRLFDRFYRADKARTFEGGYGIGLSMAKAIAEKHKGEIAAYKKEPAQIGFKVVL